MAKIKFGMMMTDARGKLGGQVFSKNRGGSYIRTKVTPNNPQSADQSTVRTFFGLISQEWSGLSNADRKTWNEAVDSYQQTNIFGDLVNPSGKALYQRLNQNLRLAGESGLSVAPAVEGAPDIAVSGVSIDTTAEEITLAKAGGASSYILQVRASGPVSAGTSNVSNKFKTVYYDKAGGTAPADTWAGYVDKFGTPQIGERIFFQVYAVYGNGVKSPAVKYLATIS